MDISGEMKDKTAELYKLLVNWRRSVNAQMPSVNPEYRSIIKN